MIRVSILICTYNRAPVLDMTLCALSDVVGVDAPEVEVIVVDNNSDDATAEIAQKHQYVRYSREEQQGLSHARNRGLQEARGEWVVFLDDDVVPNENWLLAYLRFIEHAPKACVFLGGRVGPLFEVDAPSQLVDHMSYMQGVWGLCESHSVEQKIDRLGVDLPVGANFGGRRDDFLSVGFDPGYGRVGEKLSSFEETLLMETLIRSGSIGYWVPGAEVAHRVPESRMSLEYIARFYEGLGQSHWSHKRHYSRWKLLKKFPKCWWRCRRQVSIDDAIFCLKDYTRQFYILGACKSALCASRIF